MCSSQLSTRRQSGIKPSPYRSTLQIETMKIFFFDEDMNMKIEEQSTSNSIDPTMTNVQRDVDAVNEYDSLLFDFRNQMFFVDMLFVM